MPLGRLMLAIAAALVVCALFWARFVDRRRRPRQPAVPSPAREATERRVRQRIG